jgi:hypothetical protein
MIFLRKKNELCMVNIYCDKRDFTHQNTGTNKTNDQLILPHGAGTCSKFPVYFGVVLNYETKSKRNERNETKRNETKRNETKYYETQRNILKGETKRNATKRNLL